PAPLLTPAGARWYNPAASSGAMSEWLKEHAWRACRGPQSSLLGSNPSRSVVRAPINKRMLKRRLTRRVALGAATALLTTALFAAGLFYYQIHRANAAVQELTLPTEPPPARGDRLLVLAPHCDDETLGVGASIAHAARVGARVRVILVTNGDGFPL